MLQRNLYQKDDHPKSEFQNNNNSSINVEKVPLINQISINLKNPCEQRPHSEMKEECKTVTNKIEKNENQFSTFNLNLH